MPEKSTAQAVVFWIPVLFCFSFACLLFRCFFDFSVSRLLSLEGFVYPDVLSPFLFFWISCFFADNEKDDNVTEDELEDEDTADDKAEDDAV